MKKLSWLLILPVLVIASCGGQKSTPSSSVAPQESSSLSSSEEQSSSSAEDKSSSALPSSSSAAPSSSSQARESSSQAPSSSSQAPSASSSAKGDSSNSNNNSSSVKPAPENVEIPITLNGYDTKVIYNDAFFNRPSYIFDKELALFSFGAAVCTSSKTSILSFYSQATFTDVLVSDSYNIKPTDKTIGYSFASKQTDYGKVILATIRGLNYGAEWASNLDIGASGNHAGFEAAANEFISALEAYIMEYDLQSANVLVAGYSRGGGVANVAADLLFKKDEEQKLIADENFSFYTFEAPRGLAAPTSYNNVFNVVNSADIIPYFAPEQYGLYRCGTDIDVYDADVDNIVKTINENITLPTYTPNSTFPDEQTFIATLIEGLTNPNVPARNISTRELFIQNIQPTAQYAMKLFFSLKDTTVALLKSDLSTMQQSDFMTLINSGQDMHDFIVPYLELDGCEFDDEELLGHCNIVNEFIKQGPGTYLLVYFALYQDLFMRVISMHYDYVDFALLSAFSAEFAVVAEQ